LFILRAQGSYDPNWREFIGTQLVQVVEEFETLLGPELVNDIENAMAYDAVGAMRRDGTAPDNLIFACTNPQYMGTLNVGCIGPRLNNQTFIGFAILRALSFTKFFTKNGDDTFGEYNAPHSMAWICGLLAQMRSMVQKMRN
jgi:hypothetical protein